MKLRYPQPKSFIERTIEEILQTDGSAAAVASSFALGTLIALLPTIGFGIFLALLLLIVFPSLHKPGLLLAFVVWNPLVQIPLYSFNLALGSVLFSGMPVMSFDIVFLDHAYNLTRRLLIANLIVSSTLAVFSYIIVFATIRRMKGRPVFTNQ